MSLPVASFHPRRAIVAGTFGLLLLAAVGCSGTPSLLSPPEPDRARGALREFLEAWKGGKPYDSMAKQPTPIQVADEDWLFGSQLVSFEISPKDQVIGDILRCPVSLSLKDKAGKGSKKTVTYNVTTSPSLSVIRQD